MEGVKTLYLTGIYIAILNFPSLVESMSCFDEDGHMIGNYNQINHRLAADD